MDRLRGLLRNRRESTVLPGGRVEMGKAAADAVAREMRKNWAGQLSSR
jgi:ADP-ribose pyrophosphatase YjhB (NUDIX family)